MISSQSVTDGVSLSVSKSKLVYNSLIFLDNQLTLICLLTQQRLITVSVCNTQVNIQLISRDLHLSGQKCKANGVYDNDTVNDFARNFNKCSPILKILSPAEFMINV